MPEIKCPNCGKTFTVDESGYAAIVAQVRDGEFHKSIEERLKHFEKEKANEYFSMLITTIVPYPFLVK